MATDSDRGRPSVIVELWFDNKRDAKRCIADLSNTVFQGCTKCTINGQ
jgi:hypothetical protein